MPRSNHLRLAAGLLGLSAAVLAAGCLGKGIQVSGSSGSTCACDVAVCAANLSCSDADALDAARILRTMSLEQKVKQMSGPEYNPNNMFQQADDDTLHIPGFQYMDGPRGVRWYNSDNGTTVYPVGTARGSTWNLELERRIGKGMAFEMRALGRHVLLAPTINQVMHPRWGRAQESYGEDSFLLGEFGAALVKGIQYDPTVADPLDPDQVVENTYRVQACVKHLVANNIEDQRTYVNAVLDDRTLREVYLPHFKKAAIDAGSGCVMASYNRVNGSYACYSTQVVRNILKKEWKFPGFVVSDWFATGNTLNSPVAGLDVEMPFSTGSHPIAFDNAYFYGPLLTDAVTKGKVDVALLDEAVVRILYTKIHNGMVRYPVAWSPYLTKSDATIALSLKAAEQGTVLLKNGATAALADDVLPLDAAAISKIGVVGMFAASENMGDKGSSDAKVVDGSLVVTPFEGIRDAFKAKKGSGATTLTYETLSGDAGAAARAALADADVIVVVGAYYYADLNRSAAGEEGEWKDRASMQLPARDLANISAAAALKAAHPATKVVVVLKSGGAVVVDGWQAGVDAILTPWFGGMNEGTALAEILFGDVVPSGKTVQSFPRAEADLPTFNNSTPGDVTYDYYHGYRWLDRKGTAPRYPFGYGLSYTTFQYSNLQLTSATVAADGTLEVKVDVKNTGARTGSEVVQLYVGYDNTAVADAWGRPKKELKGFARLEDIAPGATRTATITVKVADLAYWDTVGKAMVVEKMVHQLYVGPSSDASDANMQKTTFTVQ